MTAISSDLEQQIPSCTIRGRLIPAYDFVPRLKKLCLSLGFHAPLFVKSGKLAPPGKYDAILVLSTKVPYEQNWGGYSGLPGQQDYGMHPPDKEQTPADLIRPYLQQYQSAQTHIHLSCNSAGQCLMTLPDYLIHGPKDHDRQFLRVEIAKIAEPNEERQYLPVAVSGPLLTYQVTARFRQAMDAKNFPWKIGRNCSIGEHLTPDYFGFAGPIAPDSGQHPFLPVLLPLMPWIVAHKTPQLAATLVHLQSDFLKTREQFAATGSDDPRNLLCVAGLDIDMQGFRGRTERYFVPWQACWKRHGHCYGNIYPLLQNDLFVALMNMEKPSS